MGQKGVKWLCGLRLTRLQQERNDENRRCRVLLWRIGTGGKRCADSRAIAAVVEEIAPDLVRVQNCHAVIRSVTVAAHAAAHFCVGGAPGARAGAANSLSGRDCGSGWDYEKGGWQYEKSEMRAPGEVGRSSDGLKKLGNTVAVIEATTITVLVSSRP